MILQFGDRNKLMRFINIELLLASKTTELIDTAEFKNRRLVQLQLKNP